MASFDRELPRALEDALPYVVYVFDLDTHQTVDQRRSFGRELDYPQEVIDGLGGRFFRHVLHPDDLAKLPQRIARWARALDSEVLASEYRLQAADGRWRTFTAKECVYERDDSGNVVRIVGTAIDTTERQQLEDQLRVAQRLEAVGQLAAGVAHDFNNIMTAILGYIQLGRRDMNAPEVLASHLDELETAARRAASVSKQLLSATRRRATGPEVLDLNQQIAQLAKLLGQLLGENVELVTDLEPGVPPVLLDRADFTQLLVNLVVNARDAMPRGGRLVISTGRESSSGSERTRLTVADTGVGIDPLVRPRIFDAFFTTKLEDSGNGLGLSNVRSIVSRAGGEIVVDSAPGCGTSFHIKLPSTVGSARPSERPPRSTATDPRSETILIVEDDRVVASVVKAALARDGYHVLVARDGHEAVGHYAGGTLAVSLALIDLGLPGESGLDVVSRLLALQPELKVLLMSGHGYEGHSLTAIGRAFPILDKPFSPDALLQRILQVLDGPRTY